MELIVRDRQRQAKCLCHSINGITRDSSFTAERRSREEEKKKKQSTKNNCLLYNNLVDILEGRGIAFRPHEVENTKSGECLWYINP